MQDKLINLAGLKHFKEKLNLGSGSGSSSINLEYRETIGTPVLNGENTSTIYFNNKFTDEEIFQLVNSLDLFEFLFSNTITTYIYGIFYPEGQTGDTHFIAIFTTKNDDGTINDIIIAKDLASYMQGLVTDTKGILYDKNGMLALGWMGWNPEISETKLSAGGIGVSSFGNVPVGLQNSQISKFISSKPFEEIYSLVL